MASFTIVRLARLSRRLGAQWRQGSTRPGSLSRFVWRTHFKAHAQARAREVGGCFMEGLTDGLSSKRSMRRVERSKSDLQFAIENANVLRWRTVHAAGFAHRGQRGHSEAVATQ